MSKEMEIQERDFRIVSWIDDNSSHDVDIEMNPCLVSFGRFPCNLFPRFSSMGFLLQVDRG